MCKYLFLLIFFVPLVFNPWGGANPYELTKVSWVIFIIGLFFFMLIFSFWNKGKFVVAKNKMICWIAGLWGVSYILSTIFSIAPIESFWGSYERFQGLITVFYYGVHFFLCLQLLREQKLRNFFFTLTLVIGFLLALYAVFQKFGIDLFSITPPKILAGRSFATMGHPNDLGQFLIFPFFISFLFFISIWGKNRKKSTLLLCLGIFLLIGILLTKNRASILGIAIALAIFFLTQTKWKTITKTLLVIGIIALFIGSIGWFGFDFRSLGTRSVLWRDSLKLIPEYFVFGSGPATYYQTIQTVLSPDLYLFERMTDIPDRTHNEILEVFLSRGIFGLLLYFFNIAFLVYILLRKKLSSIPAKISFFGIIAYGISVQFGFSSATHMILLLAFWSILLIETADFSRKKIFFSIPSKILVSVFLIFITIFSISFSYRLIQTDTLFRKAISYYLKNESEALQTFSKTIAFSPQYSYLYRSVFIFYENYLGEDKNIYEIFANYAEQLGKITNHGFHFDKAKAKLALGRGDLKKAYRFFEKASQKAPNWPVVFQEWGEAAFTNNDFKTAIEKFEKFVSLAPPYWKWQLELHSKTAKAQEQYRIFKISNQSFFEVLAMLAESYERIGKTTEANKLRGFL